MPADNIHVRYNEQTITFRRTWLDDGGISTVEDLIDEIKRRLKNTIENISDKIITLRRGESEVLGSETPISGLYNTRETALHVVAGKHNIQLYLLMNILLLLLTLLFLIYDV